ncbi:Hypothetical predicted protein [Mytilus galloprovincialis]|uniref:HECT-type E3 ubiquitin transferase n=1 Tax=Mytilus galloprovincialis TaxID=29158 RepID=A0A8B6ESS6_MYTGA|nr:Hypothetical predicted protein [Mytilus galloprovincialis]
MATLLLVSCLLGSVFTSCIANSISHLSTVQKSVPKISFYPCVIPTVDKLQFCCVTENIHTATVQFYRESSNITTVHHPCDVHVVNLYSDYNVSCKSVGTTTVMYLDVPGFNHQTDPTLFGCRYYGKSAGYNLFSSHILTENKGYKFTNITQNSTLTWDQTNNNFKIVNPAGEIIIQKQNSVITVIGNKSKMSYTNDVGNFSLILYNTKKEDNGTYVYVTNSKRSGITLVVLDKLDLPIIQNITTSLSSGKIWANMSCTAEQKSGAPLFYRPTFEVLWKYPRDARYSVIQNGSNLILEEVDCSSENSQPLFCSVRELKGSYSDSQHFYPHTLCTFKPVTVPPPSEDEKNGGLIAGVVILSLLCAVLLIIAYCGKDKVKKCCRSMCGLCRRSPFCICRKCMKDDLDFDIHEPRFQMPHGDFGRHDDLDWRQILDLYSGDHPPTVPPPRPMLSTPRPDQYLPPPPPRPEALQGTSSSDNTVTFENDESGIDNPDFQDDEETVNGDDITVSDVSTLGATGVDHSTLVREVETCLSHLKKLLNSAENQVQVRRDNIIEDLINIYTDPTILQSYLHINVLGEPGSDWGGVSRDIFTSFWNEATALYFKGNDVHVPYLPPHKMEEERNFLLMGRILAHSTAILGYIPISICKSCMMVTIFNTTHIESNTLLEDFLLFVDLKDRNLIQSALNDFSGLSEDQKEDLQNLFYQFEMGCILKEETFRDQLLNMARNELVLKPRSLCEKLRLGIPEVHFDQFWSQMTIDHISILHARLKPTPEKVVKCLKLAEPLRLLDMKRRKVFQYFKDFIEQLGDEDLQKFLQFITGQNCVPKHTISVQFSNLSGAERRPVAHTCGYLIEIPEAYDNYADFETEFRNVLQSDILRFDVQ